MIGIPRGPDQFLAAACKLTHPTAMAMTVGDMMAQNIEAYSDPSGLVFRRRQCDFANKLVLMCSNLKEEELKCQGSMDEHVRLVLASPAGRHGLPG